MMLGTAIGDALGLPAETMTRDQIHERFGRITEFLDTEPGHPFMKEGWPATHWTDDTALTLATTRGLLRAGGFDMRVVAGEHVLMSREGTTGWGGSTKDSIRRFEEGVPLGATGNTDGAGNGVLMKLAPLAFYHARHREISRIVKEQQLEKFTILTHDSRMAIVTAHVHRRMLEGLSVLSPKRVADPGVRRSMLLEAKGHARHFGMMGEQGEEVATRIGRILEHFDQLDDDAVIDIADGGDAYVPHSMALVYGLFARDATYQTVEDAANLGGDTDSNAAMLGAMVGLVHGPDAFPDALKARVWRREELLDAARALARI